MRAIREKVFTHLAHTAVGDDDRGTVLPTPPGYPDMLPRYASVARVRRGEAPPVFSFRELVTRVSEVRTFNPRHFVLFRGQTHDHKNRRGETVIYPSMYRNPPEKKVLRRAVLADRHHRMTALQRRLLEQRKVYQHFIGMARFPEYSRAILQHYGVCPTPLLDLTRSLLAAATFALLDAPDGEGVVYVFGMPYPHGSISFVSDEALVMADLLACCPPTATRPNHHQALLVGRMPYEPVRRTEDDVARRLLAKYRLVGGDLHFWDGDFRPLPTEALFPHDDPFVDKLDHLVDDLR